MPTASPSAASFYPLVALTPPDSSVGINARITAALLAGDTEVVLPPGISYLDYPIVIPKGATNLTLCGHPYSGSHLQARDAMAGKAIIQVGQQDNDPSNAWDTSAAEILLFEDVEVGDTTLVKLEGESNPVVGEYYALADLATIPEWDGDTFEDVIYRSELVKVISYSAGNIGIDRPAAREYLTGDDARVYPMQTEANDVCVNIALRDFTVDGCYDEENDYYAENGIWAVLCDGISISNVTVSRCDHNCIRFDLCRDVTVSTVAVNGDVEREELYRGLNFFRCRDIECANISSDKLRHGVQFSTANSDFCLVGYTATGSYDDSPDCHGGKNHRGLFAAFTTDTSCKIGNVSYPTGDQDITIQDGVCELGIRVQGGSRVTVANCKAQAALLATIKGHETDVPNNCSFTNCVFSVPASPDPPFSTVNFGCTQYDYNDEYPISGSEVRNFKWLSFNHCIFEMLFDDDPSFNVFLEDLIGDAQVTFNDCNFSSMRVATNQIKLMDSGDDVWQGLLSIDFWNCLLRSGNEGLEGASKAVLFQAISPSEVEAIFVQCSFQNFDSPSTICIFAPGGADVSRLLNRDNSPTAW